MALVLGGLIGAWLLLITVVSQIGTGDSSYKGPDFLYFVYFGFVPILPVTLLVLPFCLITYPIYAVFLFFERYRSLLALLLVHHATWIAWLIRPEIFPNGLTTKIDDRFFESAGS